MKRFLFLFFVILMLGLVSSAETNYYVYEEKVLVEYYFDSVSDFELRIPYDVDNPEVNVGYGLEEIGNDYLIKINYANDLSIKYVTSSMIDNAKNKYYFTSKNYLDEDQKVRLILPEFSVLIEEGLVFPEPDSILSDGRSIILEWENYNEEQIIVNYESVKDNPAGYFLIWGVLLVFFAYFIFHRVVKKKPKKNLTRNLLEDEKKIVEYLLDKGEVWTKEILKDLEISKIKLSRKLRSLEQKELIKKIPYGNENKIRLVKK